MSDVSVRVAWADDASAIAEVQVAAWRASYDGLLPAEVLDALDATQLAAGWHEAMQHPPDARNRVLVALERNHVRGFCVTGPAEDPDADPVATGQLDDLTVAPEHRGNGHGSRLLQAAVDTLVADRFTLALTWLATTDDRTRSFLTGAGWAADGAHRTLDLRGDGSTTVKQIRLHTAIGPGD